MERIVQITAVRCVLDPWGIFSSSFRQNNLQLFLREWHSRCQILGMNLIVLIIVLAVLFGGGGYYYGGVGYGGGGLVSVLILLLILRVLGII